MSISRKRGLAIAGIGLGVIVVALAVNVAEREYSMWKHRRRWIEPAPPGEVVVAFKYLRDDMDLGREVYDLLGVVIRDIAGADALNVPQRFGPPLDVGVGGFGSMRLPVDAGPVVQYGTGTYCRKRLKPSADLDLLVLKQENANRVRAYLKQRSVNADWWLEVVRDDGSLVQ